MSVQDTINYYSDLLIMQYADKPKAVATIKALAKLAVIDHLPLLVQDAYNLDTAVGVQLKVLAKYVGLPDQFYNFTGPIVPTDADLRVLIKLKIMQNNSSSSLADIQKLIKIFLSGHLTVFDHLSMRMSYFFDSDLGSSDLAEIVVTMGMLPRPIGVGIAVICAPSIDNWFGSRTYRVAGYNNSGLNTYTSYHEDRHWLNYGDCL